MNGFGWVFFGCLCATAYTGNLWFLAIAILALIAANCRR